jgi:hypothetical protein
VSPVLSTYFLVGGAAVLTALWDFDLLVEEATPLGATTLCLQPAAILLVLFSVSALSAAAPSFMAMPVGIPWY